MQIIKEMPDGSRVVVDDMTHAVDCKAKGYRRIVNEKSLIIYALQRLSIIALVAQVPLVYGGRNNPRHKDNYRGA